VTDQTPEPLTDARLRQLRDDEYVCTNANERSMAAELIDARARIAELEEQSRRVALSVQIGFALDLWMALGCPVEEFDGYMERNSIADTWANLLGVVRNIFHLKCGKLTDDGPCVLSEHEVGPCHSRGDVGSSEPVPHAEPIKLEASQPFPAGYVTGFLNDQDRVCGLEHVAYPTRGQAVERAEYRRPALPGVAVYALRKVSDA
jgi:hypothetical protein